MLGQSALWNTAKHCHSLLLDADVAHAIVGGVAVCLHGYRRNTVDLDMLICREDADSVRQLLVDASFEWNSVECEFTSPDEIPVQFLLADDPTGKSGSGVLLPNPTHPAVVDVIEDLSVVTLARLIEMKIACGQDNNRRTHKDFADVVELIDQNQLGRDFARFLHKAVRKPFRELVLRSRGE